MPRGKKTREEDKAKVVVAKIKDPQKSLRDLEKETWVNRQTAKDILDKVPEVLTASDRQQEIVNKLDETIELAQNIINNNLRRYFDNNEPLKPSDVRQISAVTKETFDRKQIITWKPTEIKDVNINFDDYTDEELEKLLNE